VPRQADHQARRREIVEALWRVTARDGLAAVSFREVAAEAGVPVARVQYYFGTKGDLLLASLLLLGERIVARGMEGMAAAGPDPTPEAVLRAAMVGAQPVDEESRTDILLFFSFYVAALTDPSLASVVENQRWIHPFFVDQIATARERGETRAGIDPEHEAVLLFAANTGLSLGVLAGLLSADDAVAAIDYRLGRLFKQRR
jgi:DNA-binding transcriptional regulator YbjK